MKAVGKGLKGDAAAQAKALLAEKQPLEVVDDALIPALEIVGAKYEKGTLFSFLKKWRLQMEMLMMGDTAVASAAPASPSPMGNKMCIRDSIWLVWQFSGAVRDSWSPTVRPPRLGGNTRMGAVSYTHLY